MPIYKQRNELEGDSFETGDLFYKDGDPRQCTETTVVHLGSGDIAIHTAQRRSDIEDEILFVNEDEPHPIGETSDKWNGIPTHAPVALIFDASASVDSLIGRLRVVKKALKKREEAQEAS